MDFRKDQELYLLSDEKKLKDLEDPSVKPPEMLRGQTYNVSKASKYSYSSNSTISGQRWYENQHAKNTIMSTSSAFYALILSIFALVFELAHVLADEHAKLVRIKDLIMGAWMYGLGIIFLCFCYYEIYERNKHVSKKQKFRTLIRLGTIKEDPRKSSFESSDSLPLPQEILTAGSLFLRIGCVVFGLIGLVYYVFNIFLCFHDNEGGNTCKDITVILNVLAIVFIVIQGHFIFCNWKISKTRSHLIARFGTMHLVGANLWTWFRFILVEEAVMHTEVHEIFSNLSTSTEPSEEHVGPTHTARRLQTKPSIGAMHSSILAQFSDGSYECEGTECLLGGIQGVMFTSLVEYSLIGAVVMYIVWRNIKHEDDHVPHKEHKEEERLRVNLKNTLIGLILSAVFLACCIASMIIYYVFNMKGHHKISSYTFSITDLTTLVVMTVVCLIALYRMRVLTFIDHPGAKKDEGEESQELLDMILLTVGMIGEMIYSGAGLVGLQKTHEWNGLTIVICLNLIFRLIQVGLQSILIYITSKLRLEDDSQVKNQPGKQAITFLLIANLALFFMNLFEAEKFGVSETVIEFFGRKSWVYLTRSFSPLTIFYRFHSSVCLAEIWRNVYVERLKK